MDVPTLLDNFVSYGYETDDELTDARKLEAINEAYWDICSREAWPFLESSVTLTFDGTVNTPTNDPGDIGVVTSAVGANGRILEPWRRDDFLENFGGVLAQTGAPGLFYFEAGLIKVWPVPSSGNTATIQYIKVPKALLANDAEVSILIPPRWHRAVLLKGALIELAILQDDPDTAAIYKAEFEEGIARMTDDLFPQQSMRPDFIHVSDPDNYDYS